jgi:hypothetical protein
VGKEAAALLPQYPENKQNIQQIKLSGSVVDPGCSIPYPGSEHFSIPDPNISLSPDPK